MDVATIVWLVLGGITFFSFGMIILIMAGKDIVYAIGRKLIPSSVDVYITNNSRMMNHYLKVPKEGIIRVKGQPYVVNPNKVIGLNEQEKTLVTKSIDKKTNRLKERLNHFIERRKGLENVLEKVSKQENAESTQLQLKQEIENINQKMQIIASRLNARNQSYFYRRKPALFYIEGDPIPKDFFEYYTELDSIIIDNIVARAMTKDPRQSVNIEKYVKMLKWILLVAAGASAINLVMSLQLQNAVTQIADHLGITIAL